MINLYGFSERGLVNAFCYDCGHNPNGETLLAEVLGETSFPLFEDDPFSGTLCRATFIVEQSLSQFGDSDLIILCDSVDGRKTVIFCEFKRRTRWTLDGEWKKFAVRVENNIRENLASNLFCQLHFKQRFVAALADPSQENITDGLEFDEPLNIRRGTGRRKIGNNNTVLRVVDMIRPYAQNPFFLMVTPQEIAQDTLRSFLQQTNECPAGLRNWSSHRWGHLSLSALHSVCQRNRPAFDHTLSIFEFNQGQLY